MSNAPSDSGFWPCRATGATALARLGAPTADELGYAKALGVTEIGGTTVVVLEQDASAGAVSTVVLRASTDQLLDDLERAIDDGVNTYKVLPPALLFTVLILSAYMPAPVPELHAGVSKGLGRQRPCH